MHIVKAKGCRIFGYVIMPNHVHLLIHAPEGLSINAVRPSDAVRGQVYRMFMPSSDIRECYDEAMIQQKLDYIHANPVKGKWMLAENYLDYAHSSAGSYERGDASNAPVENYQIALRA